MRYLGVLIQFCVPIFVQSRSDKGVYMHFTSPVEVLFVNLPNYDAPCKRIECSFTSLELGERYTMVCFDVIYHQTALRSQLI